VAWYVGVGVGDGGGGGGRKLETSLFSVEKAAKQR
jgi:hypothetical protein